MIMCLIPSSVRNDHTPTNAPRPETGSQRRLTLNKIINIRANQKTGIDIPPSDRVVTE